MLFYKIYLVNPFDTDDEIGNRPLLRGYLKSGVNCLIENGCPFLVTYIDEGFFIRELFTGEFLRKSNFCNKPYAESEDLLKFNDLCRFKASAMSKEDIYRILALKKNPEFIKVIQKAIFNMDNDFELSTMEDLAEDRAIQLDACEKKLTNIHPYSERYLNSKALRHRR